MTVAPRLLVCISLSVKDLWQWHIQIKPLTLGTDGAILFSIPVEVKCASTRKGVVRGTGLPFRYSFTEWLIS